MPHDVIRAEYTALEHAADCFMREHERGWRVQQALELRLSVLRRGGWDAEGATEFYSQMVVILREAEEEAGQCLKGEADSENNSSEQIRPQPFYRCIPIVNQETPTPTPEPGTSTATLTPEIVPVETPADYSTPTPTPVTPEPPPQNGQSSVSGDIFMGSLPVAGVLAFGDGPLPFGDVAAGAWVVGAGVVALIAGAIISLSSSQPIDGSQVGDSAASDGEAGAANEEVPVSLPPGYTDGSGYRTDPETGQQVIDPRNLPANPDDLLKHGWVELPSYSPNRRSFQGPDGTIIDYDHAQPDLPGWRGRDHYHVRNPNRPINPNDHSADYLDVDGNPVPNGHGRSHIPADPAQR